MHARSALFDVYGDHLRLKGDSTVPVSALVALLEPLGFKAPAVRTAVSRMVKQGWLAVVEAEGQRGYALTSRARHRLDETAARVYRTRRRAWDGRLDMVVFSPPAERRRRAQLTAALRFHGYGPLTPGTWISPWAAAELPSTFAETEVAYERFSAVHNGDHDSTAELARRAWDVDALAKRYREFVCEFEPTLNLLTARSGDEVAYAARLQLVHAFRVFLFTDPQLPAELCPPDWEGNTAAAFFDAQSARLRPAAERFVDHCLQQN